ncbi:hypothetical protein RUM43_002032 [Polyplax serrata]|uniref:Uncharacterized protein n=1 Tax=Polyplax serrata TaxID=468196 RepID=A0AAN8S2F1_POLSC
MSFDQIETADYLRGHQVKLKVKCGSVGSVEDVDGLTAISPKQMRFVLLALPLPSNPHETYIFLCSESEKQTIKSRNKSVAITRYDTHNIRCKKRNFRGNCKRHATNYEEHPDQLAPVASLAFPYLDSDRYDRKYFFEAEENIKCGKQVAK